MQAEGERMRVAAVAATAVVADAQQGAAVPAGERKDGDGGEEMENLSEDDDDDEEGMEGVLAKLVGDGPQAGGRDRAKAELAAYAKLVRERQAQTWTVVLGRRVRKVAAKGAK